MKVHCLILALAAPALSACSLSAHVAGKRSDMYREAQVACLRANVAHFEDRNADSLQVGRLVAMSCTTQTEKLAATASPHTSRQEYDAFQSEAVTKAAAYVRESRGEAL